MFATGVLIGGAVPWPSCLQGLVLTAAPVRLDSGPDCNSCGYGGFMGLVPWHRRHFVGEACQTHLSLPARCGGVGLALERH